MPHRKRRRQPCSQSNNNSRLDDASIDSTTACERFLSRRRRRGGEKLRMPPSWKMTVATFLIWLSANNGGHTQQSSLVSAWGSSDGDNSTVTTTKKGLQIVGSCSSEDFQVQAVYLVCDSPGAYYRGSSTYRDSTTCIYGDKARLKMEFEITESFTGASSIRLEIESGIYDQWKKVAIMDDLCSYAGSNLQRIYSEYETMTSCPTPGFYRLDTYFTVPSFTQDSELHYTPDVRFRFYNAKGNVLGCATTGTLALSQQAKAHAEKGVIVLMTAFFALICLFSSLIYLNNGHERRLLAEKQKLQQQGRKSRSVVTNRTQEPFPENDPRYHYFNGGNTDDHAFNGSSHTSNTSNAGSSFSSHAPRKLQV